MTRNTLGLKERIEIFQYLETSLEKSENGMVWYKDASETDVTSARKMTDKIGIQVTGRNVASVRKEMFGNLIDRSSSNTNVVPELASRVTELEKQLSLILNGSLIEKFRIVLATTFVAELQLRGTTDRDALYSRMKKIGFSRNEVTAAIQANGQKIRYGATHNGPDLNALT